MVSEATAAGEDEAHAQQQQRQGEQAEKNDGEQQQQQQHVDYSIPLKGSAEESLSSTSTSALAPTVTNAPHASNNNPAISALEKRMDAELPFQTSELSTFDACIEAADAMAANDSGRAPSSSSNGGGTGSGGKNDRNDGVTDCSVLVSPDGALLFLPRQDSADGTHEIIDGLHSKQNMDLLTNMYPTEEVRSAIVTGSDLHPSGDRLANGFSVRGWSDDAASLALRRSDEALRATATFIRGLDQIHREEAARIGGTLCDDFRKSVISSSDSRMAAPMSVKKKSKFGRQRSAAAAPPGDDPNADGDTDAMISSSFSRENKLKTSPLFFPGSTLHAAAASLIQYHTTAIGSAGATRVGLTPSTASEQSVAALQMAAEKTAHRAANREAALTRAHRRVEEMEAVLLLRRQEAKSRWDAVQRLEDKVQSEYERRVRERSRELYNRKRQSEDHLSHLKDDADGDGFDSDRDGGVGGAGGEKQLNSGVTETELWQLVNQIGNEEDSSFHPLGMPEAPPRPPANKSLVDQEDDDEDDDEEEGEEEFENDGSAPSSTVPSSSTSPMDHSIQHPPLPPIDRGDVEFELNLPQLRAAALEAESEVEDAATNVLNAISALDTTERSARIAAESALLSAANAQAEAMKSAVKQERLVLEARLKQLDVLDRQVNSLDVRADLDAFVAFDRRERPGSATRLGEDDDGGVASALAVLDGHAEGADGGLGASASATSLSSFERFGGAEDAAANEDQYQNDKHKGIALSREEIDKVIAALFAERSNDDDGAEDLDDAGSLVLAVSLRSSRGRSCRASTCYALNKQRSVKTEVATNEQFDGLCRVFYALLKGCDARVPSDVANAKMCMMLSQTFYVVDHDDVFGDGGVDTSGEVSDERKRRLYVKATLVNHAFFSQEDFWVQALFQCVTESLAGSGVVSLNFDTQATSSSDTFAPSLRHGREFDSTERRQRKWYELNAQERAEAASQVHAVIFAQLGALSHSMLEFGCDQSVAVAFVRRCSVQHQLPLSQRTMLLQHLIGRRNSSAVSNTTAEDHAPGDGSENGELYAPVSEEDGADEGEGSNNNADDCESIDEEINEAKPQIDDPFKSTCAGEPVPDSNRLVALLSRGVSDRTQSAHQQHCLAILKARKTPYCVVDGMDPRQKARRDELFAVSGKRGHYPQFFLISYDDHGNEAGVMFLGGCDRLKDLNDTVDLPEDILQANPDLETWTRLLGECK